MTGKWPKWLQHVVRCSLLLAPIFSVACSKNSVSQPDQEGESAPIRDQSKLTAQQRFMLESLQNTPYFALVEYIDVHSQALPDDDPDDDFAEAKHTFTLKVITGYRGGQSETIQYTAITEKGEQVNKPDEPVLISLCRSEEGFYWPGVGASFPATTENVELVETFLNGVEFAGEERRYSFCED